MNIIQNITLDNFKKQYKSNDNGFTLLEMVTSVGVVLILAMIALLSYQGLQGNSKQAAVNKAANEVYNKAYGALFDGIDDSTPTAVADEYNLSQGKEKNIIVLVQNPYMKDKNRIKVTAMMGDDYKAVKITPGSSKSNDDGSNPGGGNVIPVPDTDDGTLTNFTYKCDKNSVGYLPILNIGPDTKVYMWETNNKIATFKEVHYSAPNSSMIAAGDAFLRSQTREEMARTQVLYETNFDWDKMYELVGPWDSTKQTQTQKDFYSVKNVVKNVSDQVELKAGVSYSISYDGDVETFAAPGNQSYSVGGNTGISDCLTSITNLGNSTNLKNINYIGSANLTEVPDSIPSTVINLRGAFENATNFNDPSVLKWDTSNVISLRSTFYNAKKFNQPIGVWDTSSLIVAQMTFSLASSFNQNLDHWDMSKVQFLVAIFELANSFNNGCEKDDYSCSLNWDTSSTTELNKIFKNAKSFNQNVSHKINGDGTEYWNTKNATIANEMFQGADSFNNGCAKDDFSCPLKLMTDNVRTFANMFTDAKSFNQRMSHEVDEDGIEYWNTDTVISATYMFTGASSFNNGSPAGVSDSNNSLNFNFKGVKDFYTFFKGTTALNQNTKTLQLSAVSRKNDAHLNSGLQCSNIHPLLLTSAQCKAG